MFAFFQASQRTEQQQHKEVPGREKKGNYNLDKSMGTVFGYSFSFLCVENSALVGFCLCFVPHTCIKDLTSIQDKAILN